MDIREAGWSDGGVQVQLEAIMKHALCSAWCFCKATAAVAVISASYNLIHIISPFVRALLPLRWNVPMSCLYPAGFLDANVEAHD